MEITTRLRLEASAYRDLLHHLLRDEEGCEEAAFGFCQVDRKTNEIEFRCVDLMHVAPEMFDIRSPFYLELNDDCRGKVIKRAHDLQASLIEFHSHPKASAASFSWSDLRGFDEFVPHVWWRLRNRPYAAVVVSPGSFDALAWVQDPRTAVVLSEICVGDQVLKPTGYTVENWETIYARGPVRTSRAILW